MTHWISHNHYTRIYKELPFEVRLYHSHDRTLTWVVCHIGSLKIIMYVWKNAFIIW